MAQQPSREFASTDSATRTQDAEFQERPVSAEFLSVHAAVYNTFKVQRHLIQNTPSLSCVGYGHVARKVTVA